MKKELKVLYAAIYEIYDIAMNNPAGTYNLKKFNEDNEEFQSDSIKYDFTRIAIKSIKAMSIFDKLCSPK